MDRPRAQAQTSGPGAEKVCAGAYIGAREQAQASESAPPTRHFRDPRGRPGTPGRGRAGKAALVEARGCRCGAEGTPRPCFSSLSVLWSPLPVSGSPGSPLGSRAVSPGLALPSAALRPPGPKVPAAYAPRARPARSSTALIGLSLEARRERGRLVRFSRVFA